MGHMRRRQSNRLHSLAEERDRVVVIKHEENVAYTYIQHEGTAVSPNSALRLVHNMSQHVAEPSNTLYITTVNDK